MGAAPSRREFLGAVGGLLTVGALASVGAGASLDAAAAVPGAALPRGGAPFTQPHELASAGGRLDVELVAAPAKVPFGSGERFAYTYNGTTPGPTLRVRPGDVLTITLENRLGESTNLHTHGLHVSPSGQADNVFVSVPDGGRHTYRYRIPADHRSGTFWYHPHMHGMVARQVFGGLAGVIVVEDVLDQLPALAGATERVLVLSDPGVGSSSSVLEVSMMEEMRRPRGRCRRRERRGRADDHRAACRHARALAIDQRQSLALLPPLTRRTPVRARRHRRGASRDSAAKPRRSCWPRGTRAGGAGRAELGGRASVAVAAV